MVTTILDAVGAALIVGGFAVAFGLAGALVAGGAAFIAVSWAVTKGGKE